MLAAAAEVERRFIAEMSSLDDASQPAALQKFLAFLDALQGADWEERADPADEASIAYFFDALREKIAAQLRKKKV